MGQNRLDIGRHDWKHLGHNQDTDEDQSTNNGEQDGSNMGEETKAEEDKVWQSSIYSLLIFPNLICVFLQTLLTSADLEI